MSVLENSKFLFLSIFLERVAGAVHHKSDVDVKTDFSEQKKKRFYRFEKTFNSVLLSL